MKICKDSDINILHKDIECCHRLPTGGNSTNATKRVIVNSLTENILKPCFNKKRY